MDATFKCSSSLYPQLFIISVFLGEILWRPLLYIHMPDKSQACYELGLCMMADCMNAAGFTFPSDFKMISDWELSERTRLQRNMQCPYLGCVFHYGQAVWHCVGDLGLRTYYINNPRIRLLVWLLLAVPHVPLPRHQEALDIISRAV